MKDKMIPTEHIEQKIFLIRGQKVMLSTHLAGLYGVRTSALTQAVKRNQSRFPEDFIFELTRKEITRMSQIVTSLKFSKSIYAFTEQGVAMLSSVLRSKRAIQVNIAIMRAFVKLRKIISSHKVLAHKLSELEKRTEKHDEDIKAIFEALRELMTPQPEPPKRQIGFYKD